MAEATKAVAKVPQTLALPLFTAFCTILLWFWFIAGAAAIQSMTQPFYKVALGANKDVNDESDDCDIVEWQDPSHDEFTTSNKTCVFYKEKFDKSRENPKAMDQNPWYMAHSQMFLKGVRDPNGAKVRGRRQPSGRRAFQFISI